VILTSGVAGYFVEDIHGRISTWTPRPIQASRVFLSSLGGWLTSRGSWPVNSTRPLSPSRSVFARATATAASLTSVEVTTAFLR